jgi:superoxide reductase
MVPIKFYRCSICGKIIIVVSDGAGILNCCGTNMAELEPNTGDGAAEKHVPLIKKSNNGINVQISSIIHPMSPEHHIE